MLNTEHAQYIFWAGARILTHDDPWPFFGFYCVERCFMVNDDRHIKKISNTYLYI